MSVARSFQALGAKVKVGARKSEDIARICEMALTPFHLNDIAAEMKNVDICINTIPFPIITAKVIANMPVHTLIIDELLLQIKESTKKYEIAPQDARIDSVWKTVPA